MACKDCPACSVMAGNENIGVCDHTLFRIEDVNKTPDWCPDKPQKEEKMATPDEVLKEVMDFLVLIWDETPNKEQLIELFREGLEAGQFGYRMFQRYTPETCMPHLGTKLSVVMVEKYLPLKERE